MSVVRLQAKSGSEATCHFAKGDRFPLSSGDEDRQRRVVDASREAQGGSEPVRQGEADDPGPSSAAASVGSAALKKSIITFFGPRQRRSVVGANLYDYILVVLL